MNNIGKMYQVKHFYWLLFPSKETAIDAGGAGTTSRTDDVIAGHVAAYWSKKYNCNVTYISPNDILVLLEKDGLCKKVLSTSGEMGWIRFWKEYDDYVEEVNQ